MRRFRSEEKVLKMPSPPGEPTCTTLFVPISNFLLLIAHIRPLDKAKNQQTLYMVSAWAVLVFHVYN